MIRKLKRAVSLFCATLVFMACLATPVAAESEITDYSFYQFASIASTFLSDAVARDEINLSEMGVKGTTAGGLLGYSDAADESGIITGFIASALSASSATYTYAALFDLKGDTRDEDADTSGDEVDATEYGLAFWEYAQYGKLLKQVGFDTTGSDSSFVGKGIRWIGGNLLWLAFMAVSVIGAFMQGIVALLNILNPFRFLKPDSSTVSMPGGGGDYTTPDFSSGTIDYFEDSGVEGLSNFAAFMGDIYDAIWSWAPLLLGVWLLAMAIGILLVPNGGVMPRVKRFLLRAFALVIGVPLLAVTYTQFLSMVSDNSLFASPADAAADTVASTLVDFENWSLKQRLRAPTAYSSSTPYILQATVTMKSGTYFELTPTADTYSNLPMSALAINRAAAGYTPELASYYTDADAKENIGVSESLITRYSNSNQITASDFELYAKTLINDSYFDDFVSLAEKAGTTVSTFRDNVGSILSGSAFSWNIFANGASGGSLAVISGGGTTGNLGLGDVVDYSSAGTLSTMSMYNYLSSRFDANSMIVYSNEKASSGFVRESHYSVNLIGSGLTAFMYWFSALVELGLIAMIGWMWCMGLIVNSLRRTLRMCMAVPGAMIGSLKSFAHIVVYAIMMFLEIVITAFLFQAVAALIRGVKGVFVDMAEGVLDVLSGNPWSSTIAGTDISTIVTSGVSGELATGFGGATVVLITQIIPTVGLIMFCLMLVRLRGKVLKSVDESLTDMISRMFGVDKSAPTTGVPPAVSAGLGAGMGAAMGAKMSAGGGKSDNSSGKAIESGDAKGAVGDGGNGDASAEITDGGQASLEEGDAAGGDGGDSGGGGDINISDNDTASAAFNGESNDEADAAETGDTMTSLTGGDGSDSGAVESADSGVDGAGLNDASSGEYEEGDVETTVESAGGESVDDVQQDANEAAQEMGEQAADGSVQSGGEAGSGKDSQVAGVGAAKNGQAGQGQSGQQGKAGQGTSGKSGENGAGKDGVSGSAESKDGKDGSSSKPDAGQVGTAAAGVAAAGGVGAGAVGAAHAGQHGVGTQSGSQSGSTSVAGVSGKTDGADGAVSGTGSDSDGGQSAQGELATNDGKDGTVGAAVVPEGGASATLSDAYSRNAEARSRLAALEAQQGVSGGTAGSGTAGGVSGTAGKAGVASGSGDGQKSIGGVDGQKSVDGKSDDRKSAGAVAGATAVGGIAAGGVAAGVVGASRASNPAAVAAAAQGQKSVAGVSGHGSAQGQVSGQSSVGSIGGGREPNAGQVGAARSGGQSVVAGVAGAAVQGAVASGGQMQGQVGGARQPAASVGAGQPSVAGVGAVASGQGSGQVGGVRQVAAGESRPDRMGPSAPIGPAVSGGAGAPGVPGGGRTTLSVEGSQAAGSMAMSMRGSDGGVTQGQGVWTSKDESRYLSQSGPGGSVSADASRFVTQSGIHVTDTSPTGGKTVVDSKTASMGSSYAVRITSDGGAPVIAPAAPAPGVSGSDGSGKGHFGPSYVEERSGSDTRTVRTTTTRTPVGKEAPSQKSVAGIAAQAAVAAMMANSNSPFMKAAGQVGLMGVAREMYGGQLGERGNGFVETTTEEVVEHHDSSSRVQHGGQQLSIQEQIENLDADTAAIEARIRELEQQRAAQRQAKPRQLNEQAGSDDYA